MHLHDSLRKEGLESKVLVKRKLGQDYDVTEGFAPPRSGDWLWRRLSTHLDALPARFLKTANTSDLSPAWLPNPVHRLAASYDPDVTVLHWICDGFLRPEDLARFRKPLVWNAYDMWPICGAEHYAGDSTRHIDGYRRDNRPADESGFDVNRWVWQRKLKAWRNLDATLVVGTTWLADQFRRSPLFRDRPVEIIPHGVDPVRFKPMDQAFARQVLNLPQDKRLLVFGALGGLNNRRKGGHLLMPALAELGAQGYGADTELVIFGASTPRTPPDLGLPAHYIGRVDDIGLCLAYVAADVFVAPSTEDNLPLTVLEAMSCGCPVAAFDIAGMLDAVIHQENGTLARSFDSRDLAACLAWLLADRERRANLGRAARRLVEERFTLARQAAAHLRLYESLLGP